MDRHGRNDGLSLNVAVVSVMTVTSEVPRLVGRQGFEGSDPESGVWARARIPPPSSQTVLSAGFAGRVRWPLG